MKLNNEHKVGDVVEIFDDMTGAPVVEYRANIDRVTRTQIVTISPTGNEVRFNKVTGKQIGYAWPQLTLNFRPVAR